jgi:peptidyl-prolyl cis-trans isomerase SurA
MFTSARIRRLLPAFAAAAALAVLSAAPASAQSISVVVNGQPILSSEVAARVALLKLSGGGKGASVAAAKQELIDEKLKVMEAKRYGMTASDAQVDAAFASIAQRTKMSPDQFAKAIGQRGVSAQTLKSRIGAEMVWAQLVRRKFAAQFASKERDVIAQMASRGDGKASNKATQYTLRQVVFVLPKGASEAQATQRRQEAINARGRFPGCDGAVQFAAALRDVAVKEPITRSSGALGKELTDILDKVKIGGLTEPQRADQGFEMIAVCERKEIADDSVLRQAAQEELGSKAAQEQAEKYLAQLRSRAVIENR